MQLRMELSQRIHFARRMQQRERNNQKTREFGDANTLKSVREMLDSTEGSIAEFGAVKADRQAKPRRRLKFVHSSSQQSTICVKKHFAARCGQCICVSRNFRIFERLAIANPNDRRASL